VEHKTVNDNTRAYNAMVLKGMELRASAH